MMNTSCANVTAPRALSVFTSICSAPICLTSTIGNALVIFVVIKDPLKHHDTPFYYFLVNLAFCDLIVGLVTSSMSVYLHAIETIAPWGAEIQIVFQFSYIISITASVFSLIALTVDRFISIARPMEYRNYLHLQRCVKVSVIIWVLAFTVPFIRLKVGYFGYLMTVTNSGILLAFCVLLFAYFKVKHILRKQTDSIRSQFASSNDVDFVLKRFEVEKKVTRVFFLILLLFCVTYLVGTVMICVVYLCTTCDCIFIHVLRDLQFLFILTNSCMNPLICITQLGHFKSSLKSLFCSRKRLK